MTQFFDESFVIAICFIIFIYLGYRPIKKAIITSLDAKIAEIKQKLHASEKLKADAKRLLIEVESELATLQQRELDILEATRISTKHLIENRKREIDLLLAHKKESAVKSIQNESLKASKAIQAAFTDKLLQLVTQYLAETKNNSVSDKDLMVHLLQDK